MEAVELIEIISRGEDSRHQFKENVTNADEVPARGMNEADIDMDYFKKYFQKQFGESVDDQEIPLTKLLENMDLMKDGIFNLAGALLFANNQEHRLPLFCVKGVAYPGEDIHASEYRDSEDIHGKLEDVFNRAVSFISRNIRRIQRKKHVNSIGDLEIPKISLEEITANALVHRDYFVSAPIRIFIFENCVKIISPGHLPNNLTIENIKKGISMIRNPILASLNLFTASGGQGDSFRENRPPGPPAKAFD